MSHLHLKIKELVEDQDGEGKPRLRARVEEFKPRTLYVNLKNANAEKIQQLKGLVGGDAMLPIREGMVNGQTFFQLLVDDEIIPIHAPEKIATGGIKEISTHIK